VLASIAALSGNDASAGISLVWDHGADRRSEPIDVEKLVNDFLRYDVGSTLLASLEQIGEAIDAETNKSVFSEDWTIMRNYVQRCHERLPGAK
jgi:hypothetical protein